ncbi:MAG: hypothetical protein HYT93_02150 [Parcubacteria group bacterium]|nr:hypothetical protein [Parcubacteria group bacterium]
MVYTQNKIKKIFKGIALLFGLFILFVLKTISGSQGDEGKTLTLSQKAHNILFGSTKGTPLAHADTPPPPPPPGCGGGSGGGCSLIIEYWNGISFVPLDIYSPRYYQPTLNTITIPKEAIQKRGNVQLRVTATKKHKVYFAGLISPKKNLSYETEQFSVARAYHKREEKDYARILNSPRSGEYLHTIPGDVVDVSFKVVKPNISSNEQYAFMLQAGGVYTAASEEAQKEAGDWAGRLDLDSKSFLKKLYTLNTYQNKGKNPVLS